MVRSWLGPGLVLVRTGEVLLSVAVFVTSEYVQVAVFSWVICRSALQNHHPADRQTGKYTGQHTGEQTGES